MEEIKQRIPTGSRHKLLFTSHHPEGMVFINVGGLLAKAIESSLQDRQLPMIALEAITKIIQENVKNNPEIGKYVAISNIGILFEPALRLDLHSLLSRWSQSYTLIVDMAAGIIKNKRLYLSHDADNRYSIDLSDISHNTYYDEI